VVTFLLGELYLERLAHNLKDRTIFIIIIRAFTMTADRGVLDA
jgi:hypothetical protein